MIDMSARRGLVRFFSPSGGWAVPGALSVAFVAVTVGVLTGFTAGLDRAVAYGSWRPGGSAGERLGLWVVMAGQRFPTAVLLLVVAAVLGMRARSWRPVVVSVAALVSLNVVVGALKLLTARSVPSFGRDVLFANGTAFPSGHASNAVLTWGLMAVLVLHFKRPAPAFGRAIIRAVIAICAVVGLTSIYLATHWVTDIIAGWAIGGLLLWAVLRALPLELVAQPANRDEVLGVRGVQLDLRTEPLDVYVKSLRIPDVVRAPDAVDELPTREHASRVA
jgi:undecaprenyl-diphosphatase